MHLCTMETIIGQIIDEIEISCHILMEPVVSFFFLSVLCEQWPFFCSLLVKRMVLSLWPQWVSFNVKNKLV